MIYCAFLYLKWLGRYQPLKLKLKSECVVFFNMQNSNFRGAPESERTGFVLLHVSMYYEGADISKTCGVVRIKL